MKLPKTLNICGRNFDILLVKMGKKTWGETNSEKRWIKINKNFPENTYRDTLLHEVIHAVIGVAGLSNLLDHNLEESLAIALENGLAELVELKLDRPNKR